MAYRKFHGTAAVRAIFLEINISSVETGDGRVTVASIIAEIDG